jgi:translocation and assembly module TamA
VPVDIIFQEKVKPYHFEVGAGYDTYVGFRVHSEVTKYNFWGNAQKLQAKVSWSNREQLLEGNYFKPVLFRLFDYSFDFGTSLGYSNLEFEGFQEEKSFAKAYISYNSSKVTLNIGLSTENIFIKAIDNLKSGEALEQAINEGQFLLFYPYIDVVYDGRDSKLNPKYGYYLSAYTELGMANEKDDSVYLKMLFEGRLIYTWQQFTFSTVGKIGVVDESSDKGLPESKYFFGGGAYSNRAYGYQEIGVILSPTEESIHGASSLLNLSLEVNYPLWGELYGAVFSDNTMLNEKSYDFEGEILSSVGMGIRYMTPIGPFKLDVGVNRKDSSQYGILFQIGQSF